jgi:hypothetical protein
MRIVFPGEAKMPRRAAGPIVALTTFTAFAVLPNPAWSWGGDGHRTVGAIADLILQSPGFAKTRDQVNQLLEGTSLSDAAVWMDCAKGFTYCHSALTDDEKAYVAANHDHHAYHYTDVPIQQTEYQFGTAGTKNDDAVQIIRYAVSVLRDSPPKDGPAKLTPKQAVWVLAHLVGDIHQPLHAGAAYYDQDCENLVDPNVVGAGQPDFGIGKTVVATTGGNDFHIGSSKNLHAYWDDSAVIGAMRLKGITDKSAQKFAQAIVNAPPRAWRPAGDVDTWSTQWASEVLPLADQAVTDADISEPTQTESAAGLKCTWTATVDRNYSKWANQQALNQLGKAGFRLAALLQAIFEGR